MLQMANGREWIRVLCACRVIPLLSLVLSGTLDTPAPIHSCTGMLSFCLLLFHCYVCGLLETGVNITFRRSCNLQNVLPFITSLTCNCFLFIVYAWIDWTTVYIVFLMILKIFSDVFYNFLFILVFLCKGIVCFTAIWISISFNCTWCLKKKWIYMSLFLVAIKSWEIW
jgi:hypothetical protein